MEGTETGIPRNITENTSELQRALKQRVEEEFLVKIGAIEEPFKWHPDIQTRRPERPKSSISLEYQLDIKVGKPKTTKMAVNSNKTGSTSPTSQQPKLRI